MTSQQTPNKWVDTYPTFYGRYGELRFELNGPVELIEATRNFIRNLVKHSGGLNNSRVKDKVVHFNKVNFNGE